MNELHCARFEAELAPNVVLLDISYLLPRYIGKYFPLRKKPVTTLMVHHTGADNGKDGIDAVAAMAHYHVRHKKWPEIGYHYIITRRPTLYCSALVVFRVGEEQTVRAHTRLCNRFSSGVALQGNFNNYTPSEFQLECMEALIPWWMEQHHRKPSKDLGWHSCSWKWGGVPKPKCPGKYLSRWLADYKDLCQGH